MTQSARLIPPYVENWFARGLLIWNLKPGDLKTAANLRMACEATFVGVGVGATVQFLIVAVNGSQSAFAQLFRLPLYAISQILAASMFVCLLMIFLYAFNVTIDATRAASATLYALSGLLPVALTLSAEVLNHAIQQYTFLRDPSNPYFSASVFDLVNSEGISLWLASRVALEMIGATLVAVAYLARLRKMLISVAARPASQLRITLALLGALIVQGLFFRFLLGRIYWELLGKTLG